MLILEALSIDHSLRANAETEQTSLPYFGMERNVAYSLFILLWSLSEYSWNKLESIFLHFHKWHVHRSKLYSIWDIYINMKYVQHHHHQISDGISIRLSSLPWHTNVDNISGQFIAQIYGNSEYFIHLIHSVFIDKTCCSNGIQSKIPSNSLNLLFYRLSRWIIGRVAIWAKHCKISVPIQ